MKCFDAEAFHQFVTIRCSAVKQMKRSLSNHVFYEKSPPHCSSSGGCHASDSWTVMKLLHLCESLGRNCCIAERLLIVKEKKKNWNSKNESLAAWENYWMLWFIRATGCIFFFSCKRTRVYIASPFNYISMTHKAINSHKWRGFSELSHALKHCCCCFFQLCERGITFTLLVNNRRI